MTTSTLMNVRKSAFASNPMAGFPAKTLLGPDGGRLSTLSMGDGIEVERVDLASLGILPSFAGGAKGFHANGDIVTETKDGVDINSLWDDYQRWLGQWNADRDRLVSFLTWNTTESYEELFQAGKTADFEEATQYGVPVAVRPELSGDIMGYPFKWYDLSGRFTWQFLADANASQVDAFANMAQEADNRLVFLKVMRTLFNNTRSLNKQGQNVYPFYSGAVGDKPADYKMSTFADQHNHFVTTANATLLPAHLENLVNLLAEHGYTRENGYDLVVMVNKQQGNVIRQFRSVPNGGTGLYDFVPAQGTPSFLLPTDMRTVGAQPPSSVSGFTVIGSYGEATIIQEDYIPAGYVVAFVTGGEDSLSNPIAFRQHKTSSLQGLRLVKGRTPDYPLIDSYYVRGFGCGVRNRGAGAVMQVTASPTYTAPAVYA